MPTPDTILQETHDPTRPEAQAHQPADGPGRAVKQRRWPAALPAFSRKTPARAGHFVRLGLLVPSGIGILLLSILVSRPAGLVPPSSPLLPIGQLAFGSSGQLDPTSSTGLNDLVTLSLMHLPALAPSTHDTAWLLPDAQHREMQPLLLGTLLVARGEAHLNYVQPDHHNLLLTYSGVCITETPDAMMLRIPSPDLHACRDLGSIPAIAAATDEQHYSLLDHLRHLLASDPSIEPLGLSGGLGVWLLRNTGKLFEWSSAARDSWAGGVSTELIHRHMIRLLDYLDGVNFAWRDVPTGSPWLVDTQAGHVGLLSFTTDQTPPGYLAHVGLHVQGVANAPGHTAVQTTLAMHIQQALDQVQPLLQQIRADARSLVSMSDAQLQQPATLALLNDLSTSASTAYAGQGDVHGVVWIGQQLAQLAVIPITTHA